MGRAIPLNKFSSYLMLSQTDWAAAVASSKSINQVIAHSLQAAYQKGESYDAQLPVLDGLELVLVKYGMALRDSLDFTEMMSNINVEIDDAIIAKEWDALLNRTVALAEAKQALQEQLAQCQGQQGPVNEATLFSNIEHIVAKYDDRTIAHLLDVVSDEHYQTSHFRTPVTLVPPYREAFERGLGIQVLNSQLRPIGFDVEQLKKLASHLTSNNLARATVNYEATMSLSALSHLFRVLETYKDHLNLAIDLRKSLIVIEPHVLNALLKMAETLSQDELDNLSKGHSDAFVKELEKIKIRAGWAQAPQNVNNEPVASTLAAEVLLILIEDQDYQAIKSLIAVCDFHSKISTNDPSWTLPESIIESLKKALGMVKDPETPESPAKPVEANVPVKPQMPNIPTQPSRQKSKASRAHMPPPPPLSADNFDISTLGLSSADKREELLMQFNTQVSALKKVAYGEEHLIKHVLSDEEEKRLQEALAQLGL